MLLSYLAESGIFRNTGIREHNIELALLRLICAKRRSRSPRLDTSPGTPVTFLAISFTPQPAPYHGARYEHVSSFVHKLFRRRKTDAAIATSKQLTKSSPATTPMPGSLGKAPAKREGGAKREVAFARLQRLRVAVAIARVLVPAPECSLERRRDMHLIDFEAQREQFFAAGGGTSEGCFVT